MKNVLYITFAALLLFRCSSDNSNSQTIPESKTAIDTLPTTQTPGKLVALFENSVTSYYINKGYPRGFEYEMLQMFCKEYNLALEIKMIHNLDYMFDSLVDGNADIIAANLSVTGDRKEFIAFSDPVLRTKQVLVQRLPEGYRKMSKSKKEKHLVLNALDLDEKTIHIHRNTAYMEQLNRYSYANGLDIKIVEIDPEEGVDQLIADLSDGKLDYTILDENIASVYKKIYPNLHIKTPVSLSQNIAWAVKKDNIGLVNLINEWQEKYKGSTKWNMIYNKYFKYSSGEVKYIKNNLENIQTGALSPYDDLIQKYANVIQWDWRLLTSLIRKESRFNTLAQSNFGAHGLMQVLPTTAGRFGVTQEQLVVPEYNIQAGTRFIQWLEHYWAKRLPDTISHHEYILASYNAGPGHVLDAMHLAEKYNLNPYIWNGNVEVMLLNKSKPAYYRDPVAKYGYCRGKEPVNYVREILTFYDYYKAYTEEKSPVMQQTATAAL